MKEEKIDAWQGQVKRSFLVLPLILPFLNSCFFVGVLPLESSCGNVVWERDFGRNISDIVIANEKVFINTHSADLYCLDQNNGGTIWKHNFGPLAEGGFLAGLIVAGGKVFAGSRGSKLTCLDENTEEFLWEFQPNVTSSYASKNPPLFIVTDGKAFTTGDGFYCMNATNGKFIWGSENYKSDVLLRDLEWVVADDRVFIAGIENANWHLYTLNADNGEDLWTYKILTFLESSPIVADGRVFVWDRWQNQTMLCLNETSGSLLWQYSVGAEAFQPTISDGLVLFGASDGNFYALNESDGTLKWRYPSGYQNLPGYLNFAVARTGLDQVFIGYEVHSQSPQNEMRYQGYVRSLDSVNNQSKWATPISNNKASPSSFIRITLSLTNRTLYVTTFNDLYSIDTDTGTIQWMKRFTYWVLPPICAYDKLFVAADLRVTAFDETESAKTEVPWSPLLIGGIVAVGTAIAVAVYWLRKKRLRPYPPIHLKTMHENSGERNYCTDES